MPTSLIVIGMVVIAAVFVSLFAMVYLQTRLITALRAHDPSLWERLGAPVRAVLPMQIHGPKPFRRALLGRSPLDTTSAEVSRAFPAARAATVVTAVAFVLGFTALIAIAVSGP